MQSLLGAAEAGHTSTVLRIVLTCRASFLIPLTLVQFWQLCLWSCIKQVAYLAVKVNLRVQIKLKTKICAYINMHKHTRTHIYNPGYFTILKLLLRQTGSSLSFLLYFFTVAEESRYSAAYISFIWTHIVLLGGLFCCYFYSLMHQSAAAV